MNKLIAYLLICFSLSGCSTVKDLICGPVVVPPEKIIHVDNRLLEPCLPLVELTNPNPTFTDFLAISAENTKLYAECRRKQQDSIVFIKEMANLNKE